MAIEPGGEITVDLVKPVAGGGMLAWHDGRAVLVRGSIPGERVRARIERVGKGMVYARTTEVLVPSPDRRSTSSAPECGGAVFAHVAYERQRRLKGEILRDALSRIGRVTRPAPDVVASPEAGYRMRARLHVRGGRVGFFKEGTHDLCDAASTGQLLPETTQWIAALERLMARNRLEGLEAIELAENIPGTERACHLELRAGVETAPFASLSEAGALAGLSAARGDRSGAERLSGVPVVSDVLDVRPDGRGVALRLRRDVRAFFQGNRFVLEPLVRLVLSLVPGGPVADLYAGVGLFGLSLAAAGVREVTLVEADPVASLSLAQNAEPFLPDVRVERSTVESFVRTAVHGGPPGQRGLRADTTVVIDPPRTGVSKAALLGIIQARPARIVYVSCDPATLARDTRALLDNGYDLGELTGIDLFPNTAHVEAIASFVRM